MGKCYYREKILWWYNILMMGSLYIVATPIGNLEDITLRALRVFKEVDLIVSEDTRRTYKLLSHYGISKKLISYHEHNSKEQTENIIRTLRDGKSVALVSDAGTPCISDPGSFLVKRSREEGINVVPVPGPSSIITALSVSGLNFKSIFFLGFLPKKSNERTRVLRSWSIYNSPIVFFESPRRILNCLDDIIRFFPDSYLCLFREITKVHEEVIEGRPEEVKRELLKRKSIKGELIGIVTMTNQSEQTNIKLRNVVSELLDAGFTTDKIKDIIGVLKNASRNEIYIEFLKLKRGGVK